MKKVALFVFSYLFAYPDFLHACGSCVDYNIDWHFPFLIRLIPLFLVWFVVRITFSTFSRKKAISFPFTYSKFPTLSFISYLIILVIVCFCQLGSLLGPFLFVTLPLWILSIVFCQKKILALENKQTKEKIYSGFERIVILVIIGIVIHSSINFNDTSRLIRKLSYRTSKTVEAQQRLVKKGSQILPEVTEVIKNFHAENSDPHLYINLLKVVKAVGDPAPVPVIAKAFKNIKYDDSKSFRDDIFSESAQTLVALNEEIAFETILQKLEELKEDTKIELVGYRRAVNCLLPPLKGISVSKQVMAYKVLGSPDFGEKIEAYREWWEALKAK